MTSDVPRFDPRVTAARGDLADVALQGTVEAGRFVEGERFTVLTETLDVKRQPRPDAPLETQMLYGDTLKVFDEQDGWGWAQADRDGYVGYVAVSAIGPLPAAPASHKVIANRTFVYPAPDIKQPPFACVPLDGRLSVEERTGAFVKIGGHGFVYAAHIAPIDQPVADAVQVAEQIVGAPYLWGGKSVSGIDCSGLVQLAWSLAGRQIPRDTDLQERFGDSVPFDESLSGLARGDLVFWRGHVGIMVDPRTLIHANAHHMLVAMEPLITAYERILTTGSSISSVRRFSHL